MSDLVKRLYEESQEVTDSLCYQAAETIEQLRAELAALREQEPFTWCFTDVHGKAKELTDDPKHKTPQDLRVYTPLYTAPQPAIPEGWQPIETAPRDNPRCLTYTPDRLRVSDEIRICPEKLIRTHGDATHWVPLPAPPTAHPGNQEKDNATVHN
jgi:hypothetical protein